MSEITFVPKEEFPHIQWIAEEQEFLSKKPFTSEINGRRNGFNIQYGKYLHSVDQEEADERLKTVKKMSLKLADEFQTYKEQDLPEDEPVVTPDNDTQEGVELIDGKPVTEADKIKIQDEKDKQARELADAEAKKVTAEESSAKTGTIIGAVITLATVGFFAWLGFKKSD